MKKIINGKSYDTETAKCVGIVDDGGTMNDYKHRAEKLYQKKTGEFFLYCEGGAGTDLAQRVSYNSRIGSRKIYPLTYKEAQEWGEKNLDGNEYEEIFGIVDDGSRVTLNLSISAATANRAKRYAAQKGVSVSSYIESLIENASPE